MTILAGGWGMKRKSWQQKELSLNHILLLQGDVARVTDDFETNHFGPSRN